MKIVRESLIEGVADKYLENKGIKEDPDTKFEKEYSAKNINKNKVVYRKGDWILAVNPDFKYIKPQSRGIIMSNGDLYMENHSKMIHDSIIRILIEEGIIDKYEVWNTIKPLDVGYLTVIYAGNNIVLLGDGNEYMFNKMSNEERQKQYGSFLDKVKQNYNNIDFRMKFTGQI